MLIMCSRVWQARREARQNNCRNPASEAELAGYVWFLFRNTQTGAAQCSSLQQEPCQETHENSPDILTAQLCVRSRTGCLCVVSLQKHSDWSGTVLIMCSRVWQARRKSRQNNCRNPASEAELAGYVWFLFRDTQTGAAQCSSLQQEPRQRRHQHSPRPTCQPHNFASEAELAGYVGFLFRNTQTGAAQCSSLQQTPCQGAHENSTEPTKSRTTLHQKQNWLVMCGFSSETLRLERHSALIIAADTMPRST